VRTDHSCIAHEANLFIFGGFNGRSRFQDLHQYCVDNRKWIEIPPADNVPMSRFGHSACAYHSEMLSWVAGTAMSGSPCRKGHP